MSEEQICVECNKSGTESISRCGHILHLDCFRKLKNSRCRKCGIGLSRDIEVEKVFANIFALGLDNPEAKELKICLESFMTKEGQYDIISFNSAILGKLQKFGWDINKEDFGGPKLFYKACEFDDLVKVNLLIEFGIDLNKYGSEGLSKAHSSFDTIDRLVKLGVKFDGKIMFDAIEKQNIRMLKRLLKEGISVNVEGPNGIRQSMKRQN